MSLEEIEDLEEFYKGGIVSIKDVIENEDPKWKSPNSEKKDSCKNITKNNMTILNKPVQSKLKKPKTVSTSDL